MTEIHHTFGESWKVEEFDWLFTADFSRRIKNDVIKGLPYEPVYEPQFQNESEEKAAKNVS